MLLDRKAEIDQRIEALRQRKSGVDHHAWLRAVVRHVEDAKVHDLIGYLTREYVATTRYINYPFVFNFPDNTSRRMTMAMYVCERIWQLRRVGPSSMRQSMWDVLNVLLLYGANVELAVDDGHGWYESAFSNVIAVSSSHFIELFLFCLTKAKVNLTSWFPRYVVQSSSEADDPTVEEGRSVFVEVPKNSPKIDTASYPVLCIWYYYSHDSTMEKLVGEFMLHKFGIDSRDKFDALLTLADRRRSRSNIVDSARHAILSLV